MTKLTLGYSPCPNDTFIMAGIALGRINSSVEFDISIEDVQTLNDWSVETRLDVTKMSFFSFGKVFSRYAMLYSGGALGIGEGPVLVAKPGTDIKEIEDSIIASPGKWTTASALMCLYLGYVPRFQHMLYSNIMEAVSKGDVRFGLIIHEGRFTFRQYGLEILLDLGKWWERETGLPIPLGGFFIRRELGSSVAAEVDSIILRSMQWAMKNQMDTYDYVKRHAQEMDQNVINQHIRVYVNEQTMRIDDKGIKAVTKFLELSEKKGLISLPDLPLTAY